MPTAVEQLVSGNSGNLPVSWSDYYNAYGQDHSKTGWVNLNPDSLGAKIDNFFTGTASSARQEYENYLSQFEYEKNLKAKEAENAWTAAREDSQVQRSLNDIKAAGLNPWLALNGGSMSSAMTASQSASARYKAREQQLKDNDKDGKAASLLGTALKIIIAAALFA